MEVQEVGDIVGDGCPHDDGVILVGQFGLVVRDGGERAGPPDDYPLVLHALDHGALHRGNGEAAASSADAALHHRTHCIFR